MPSRLTGLIAAPFAPFHADGSLNLDCIERYAPMLAANGCSGAFVNGTTGESLSLTVDERRQVAERWVAAAPKGFAVIVHVGHPCLADSRTLAAHAQALGAAALGFMAPCFFRPATVDDLVACCAEVAAAAPRLPFYYYHIPSMTGVGLPAVDFFRAAADRIPNLAGAKFTYEDLCDFGQCLDFQGGRFDLLYGRDEALLAGLVLGARGAVGTTYSFAAPLYRRLLEAFQAGDLAAARHAQEQSRAMVDLLRRRGGLPAFKAAMNLTALDCGPCRLPLRTLTEDETCRLRADLDALGFFAYCSRP
jgi:N-acetylneuraminate lyase